MAVEVLAMYPGLTLTLAVSGKRRRGRGGKSGSSSAEILLSVPTTMINSDC